MAITKKAGISSLSSRKEVRKILTQQLENVLTDLKKELGEEKFLLRLKKAVKALTKDFEGVHSTVAPKSIIEEEEPIAEKLPSKVKKAAIKKAAKKKAVKESHTTTPSKAH